MTVRRGAIPRTESGAARGRRDDARRRRREKGGGLRAAGTVVAGTDRGGDGRGDACRPTAIRRMLVLETRHKSGDSGF